MSSLNLSHVTKEFQSITIIRDLSIEIHPNEALSLLGPSGCGKTTLLRMVAGLETPSNGRIQIGDEIVFDSDKNIFVPPEKRNLGMVFQSYAIWPHLTVLENVEFPLRMRGISKVDRRDQSIDSLRAVRLEGFEQRRPHQLSGGQQQRVALARALVARPKVLLLDEPLSNLDANLREEMCVEIAELRKKNLTTMIYVTHDQTEALYLSDRIAVLNQGQIEQLATPSEIIENPKTEFVRKFMRKQR